ncbi:hypothetical protein BDV27DRAFT_160471 [Aspergillus caelatus]|uniref:BZIP domain-containing protein n=1 Tax=Aspergillus caelatus TaxID=61420 RepID=A0A5N6ZXP8_9EURO|nr:uncharacterized protein BDV27DRAFT_160471 [Aspergillus caelatus]KAE8361666.1 hypothetical protein BDV27DRAFT_160471 [Aspergillus caelatus]
MPLYDGRAALAVLPAYGEEVNNDLDCSELSPTLQQQQQSNSSAALLEGRLQTPRLGRKEVEAKGSKADRRRMQIRLAQRAYRSRKEESLRALKTRVSLLENTLQGARDTLLEIQNMATDSGNQSIQEILIVRLRAIQQSLSGSYDVELERKLRRKIETSARVPPPFTSIIESTRSRSDSLEDKQQKQRETPFARISLSWALWPVLAMSLADFIEWLHTTCLYVGYLGLSDASVRTSQLEYKFGLLLTLMDRNDATSLFASSIRSKIDQTIETKWENIPFLRLGGAGIHYPGNIPREAGPRYRQRSWIPVDVSDFSPSIKSDLSGDWFDLHDLAGYLAEHVVTLSAPISASRLRTRFHAGVDQVCLLQCKDVYPKFRNYRRLTFSLRQHSEPKRSV